MTTSDKTMHTTDAKTLLLGEQALPMAAMEPAMITASKSIAAATLMGTLGDRVALSAIRMTVAEAALVAARTWKGNPLADHWRGEDAKTAGFYLRPWAQASGGMRLRQMPPMVLALSAPLSAKPVHAGVADR